MYGILLIAVMVITGGAIAFIGDRLGSKVGKKRLSLFGLRPRHTSTVVTIITGILITTTSLAVMSAVSENVRTALFGMEQLDQEMQSAKDELSSTSAKLTEAQAQQREAEQAMAKSKVELDKLQTINSQLEKRAQELQLGNETLEQAKQALIGRNNDLSTANEQLIASKVKLEEGNKQLEEQKSTLEKENSGLENQNSELKTGIINMREGDIVFRAGEVLASGVIKGNRPYKDVMDDLQKLTASAENSVMMHLNSRVSEKIDEADQQIWVYQPEYDEAAKYISANDFDVVVRIMAAGNMLRGEGVRTTLVIYQDKVIFNPGDLVYSHSYEVTGANQEAENILVSFLKDVNAKAVEKGMLADPLSGAVGVIDGQQIYTAVDTLGRARGMCLLSAFADGGADIQGPLKLKIKITGLGGNEFFGNTNPLGYSSH